MSPGFRQRCDAAAERLGRTPLVGRLSETATHNAIREAIASGRPRLAGWAAGQLAALPRAERETLVVQFLRGDRSLQFGALQAVQTFRDASEAVLVQIEERLLDPQLGMRVAAARCLARHAPHRIPPLLSVIEQDGGSEVARMFCLSGNQDLIVPLVHYSECRLQTLLPAIGLLLTPTWLALTFRGQPLLARRLAETFGYCEGEPTDATWERLEEGWSFVPREHADALADRAEGRRRLTRALVPTGLASSETSTEGDASDPLWQAQLLAAVRDADRSNLQESIERSPFDPRAVASPQIAAAMHASAGYLRRVFIKAPWKKGEQLGLPSAMLAAFLVDSARVALETLEESRAELEMATLAKWQARVRFLSCRHDLRIERFPILADDDAPELKSVVLKQRVPMRLARRGSPGTDSIARLALQAGLPDPSPILIEAEEAWSKLFPTVGMELQVPSVDRGLALPWKQALRYLGVPSPRRPEYFQTVEASFRPARTITSLILGPLLLLRLGLISRPQEMALHISIGADLGDRANDLAYVLYFIAMGRQKRPWPDGMKWVFSKGLVHFNSDVEPLGPPSLSSPPPPLSGRTEIRVLRCFAVEHERQLRLDPEFIHQSVATVLLATAALGEDEELASIFETFQQQLGELAESLPKPFQELRNASFYDSTGDGNDPEWLHSLPVVRALSAVREEMKTPGLRERVEAGCRRLRDTTAARVARTLEIERRLPASIPAGDRLSTPFGFSVFVPQALQGLLSVAVSDSAPAQA